MKCLAGVKFPNGAPCPKCHAKLGEVCWPGINAELLELARLRAASSWQPIETVPKDGQEVDLWCVNISDGNETRFPAMFMGEDDCKWQDWHSYLLEMKWRPTHWKPVPAGPAEKSGSPATAMLQADRGAGK